METATLKKYFMYTFLWSWILWFPFVLPSFGVYEMTEILQGLVMPVVILAAFGPLVSAVYLTARSKEKGSVKAFFKRNLSFKVKPVYYIIAIVLGLGITAFTHYFANALGIDTLPNTLVPEEVDLPLYFLVVPYTLMLFFLGGGQEEFGWRGFAQDPMQERFGVVKGSLYIGLLWALWHAPLWLIPGEGHAYYSFIAFSIYTTSWSVVIGIMYNLSNKKMVIPWIMHAMGNLSVPLFPILFLEDVPQPTYWLWALFNLIVAVIISLWFIKRQRVATAN